MKTLNVKMVSRKEIKQKWGFNPPINSLELFIRCNNNGIINWNKAPLYTLTEIRSKIRNSQKVNIKGESVLNQKSITILDTSSSMSQTTSPKEYSSKKYNVQLC